MACESLAGHPPSFNPHPARRPGVTPPPPAATAKRPRFQSSPGPEAGCNRSAAATKSVCAMVSILTRPGGRV